MPLHRLGARGGGGHLEACVAEACQQEVRLVFDGKQPGAGLLPRLGDRHSHMRIIARIAEQNLKPSSGCESWWAEFSRPSPPLPFYADAAGSSLHQRGEPAPQVGAIGHATSGAE